MLKNKIIFLDLDGTLIDHTLTPPFSAIEAINLAKANGHKLYINTGRSVCQVYDYLWELGFNGFVGGNGIYIESEGKVLFYRPIPQPLVKKVYQYLTENEIGFCEEGQESLYAHPSYLSELASLLNVTTKEAEAKVDRLFPATSYNHLDWHENVNKISIVLTEKVNLEVIRAYLRPELVLGLWSLFGNEREFGDIYQDGTSKGSAVEFVMKHLDLPMSDAFCFGDSSNDIEMIQIAGTGVAMGNAIPQLKAVADFVAEPIDEDGLWKAFRQLSLI
ncbi:MAG: HAD family hydrolase [Chloroflexi bacterium]|nr:HAD family hydrolase [Chloroflexota bacterium]